MLLPLAPLTHCLACQKELVPDPERPERFCSYQCMMLHYGPPGAARLERELTPLELHLLKRHEKAARVTADLEASLAMRKLTGTPLSQEDLEGLRWLATPDPVATAVAAGLPLPPEPWV